jgi:hypothetical protein
MRKVRLRRRDISGHRYPTVSYYNNTDKALHSGTSNQNTIEHLAASGHRDIECHAEHENQSRCAWQAQPHGLYPTAHR